MSDRTKPAPNVPHVREFGSVEEWATHHQERKRAAQRAIGRVTRGGAAATGRMGSFDIRDIGFQTRDIVCGEGGERT